eukprot:5116712-Prorocentrum_lima.AAC.1
MGVHVPLLLESRTDPALRSQEGGRGQPLKAGETQATLLERLVSHLQSQRRNGALCQPSDMGQLR